MCKKAAIAIDAGGTYFKSALVDTYGDIIEDTLKKTPVYNGSVKDRIISLYKKIIEDKVTFGKENNIDILGLGISTPGPFDYDSGTSLMDHKFASIKNISLKDIIRKFKILKEGSLIIFLHDTHAFLYGEYWKGAIKGISSAAAIMLGTGLGFGLIKDSKIVENGKGGPCISIYSLPYGDSILEDVVSKRGIISRYKEYSETEKDIDVADIAAFARNGNKDALETFKDVARILAQKLLDTFIYLDIDVVVFGGQISKAFDLFSPIFRDTLLNRGKKIKVFKGSDIEASSLKGVAKNVFLETEYRVENSSAKPKSLLE